MAPNIKQNQFEATKNFTKNNTKPAEVSENQSQMQLKSKANLQNSSKTVNTNPKTVGKQSQNDSN